MLKLQYPYFAIDNFELILLTQKTGKVYTQRSLQNKIFLSSLNYDEVETIADLLGYEIKIEKKRQN